MKGKKKLQPYHLYSPKICARKQQPHKPSTSRTSNLVFPPLVDEIDAEKVQDQTAHDVIGERTTPKKKKLAFPCPFAVKAARLTVRATPRGNPSCWPRSSGS